ncbi:MAG: FAD-dependent monooxygenase [Actinobacteria bacterium]|nr:FAD-dependent monooxygenase [Actinomycetota bacterium]
MTPGYDADVIIIGAGPVGLTAAMDLAARGASVALVDERAYLEPPAVKSNHVASRTMERFRRLGLADTIRDAGLPHDHPHDIAFLTTLSGTELGRIVLPSRDGRRTGQSGADTAWATPEPPHRINQTFLEPILARHVAGLDAVRAHYEHSCVALEQDDQGVTVTIVPVAGGAESTLRGKYLIGADGARSFTRKQIGAKLSGDAVLSHVQSTCIRAPHLYDRLRGERAWCYYTYNPRRNGHVFTIDGTGTFLVHNYLTEAEFDAGDVDRDASIRTILGVDDDFAFEVVSNEDWVARRLVVDRMRDGRVFLAGDAAHLWVPYAGFGMNAGIADALDLTWLLGAVLAGWGDERMLDAYEAERGPLTAQVSHFAMGHQRKVSQAEVPAEIEDDSAAGAAARDEIGRRAYELNVQQFAAEGLNFGYSYDASPIIAYDGAAAPAYDMGHATASTVPGCRAPHLWLADGSSLYDHLGQGYSVIALAEPTALAGLRSAASGAGVPLQVIDARGAAGAEAYDTEYVIVREDQQIAWRGATAPEDPAALVRLLRGAV